MKHTQHFRGNGKIEKDKVRPLSIVLLHQIREKIPKEGVDVHDIILKKYIY